MSQPAAVLFDLDGVLALTEAIKHAAHLEAIRHLGGQAPEDIYHQVIGRALEDCAVFYLQASGLPPRIPEYARFFRQRVAEMLEAPLEYRPNAAALLAALKTQGYRLGLVTSSAPEEMRRVLDGGGLGDFFDVRLCAADVTHKKPHPEPYLTALERLGLPGGPGVVFEDTPTGVQAARAAGLPVIVLRHPENQALDFPQAAAVLQDFSDLPAVLGLVGRLLGSQLE